MVATRGARGLNLSPELCPRPQAERGDEGWGDMQQKSPECSPVMERLDVFLLSADPSYTCVKYS